MKTISTAVLAMGLLLVATTSLVLGQQAKNSFGFNSDTLSGFPAGAAVLTGGGAYDPASGFVRAGGSFTCTADVGRGPLSGCQAGEGVRWGAIALARLPNGLPGTSFRCTGDQVNEAQKQTMTDDNTVALIAELYRQGDGDEPSFTARMFVSAFDEAPDFSGDQKVWIQGVGCGDAIANFN